MRRCLLPVLALLLLLAAPVWAVDTLIPQSEAPYLQSDGSAPSSGQVPTWDNTLKKFVSSTIVALPAGGNVGDLLVNTGSGAGSWQAAPTPLTAGVDYQPPPSLQGTTSSATPTPAAGTVGAEIRYTLSALAEGAVFGTPTGTPVNGQPLTIAIYAAAAQTLDFTTSTAYVAIGGTLPTTTVAGKWLYVPCKWNETDSVWHVFPVAQEN